MTSTAARACALFSLVAHASFAADWPQWRGPARTGHVPEGWAVLQGSRDQLCEPGRCRPAPVRPRPGEKPDLRRRRDRQALLVAARLHGRRRDEGSRLLPRGRPEFARAQRRWPTRARGRRPERVPRDRAGAGLRPDLVHSRLCGREALRAGCERIGLCESVAVRGPETSYRLTQDSVAWTTPFLYGVRRQSAAATALWLQADSWPL